MKKWKLEFKFEGEWTFYGMYGEKSVPQLVAAVCDLRDRGLEPYHSIRVVEVTEASNGEANIL